jgi:hypothetical protein
MKKVLVRSLVFVSLSFWTVLSLASGKSHTEYCTHEWRAALNSLKELNVEENLESEKDKEPGIIETYFFGPLEHLLNP